MICLPLFITLNPLYLQRIILGFMTGSLLILIMSYSSLSYGASCSPTNSSDKISFGNISSINIRNTQQATSVNDMGLSCGGGFLSIIGISGYINAVVTTTNNATLKNQSGDSIPYSMYLAPDFSYPVSPTLVINYYDATLLGILGIFNGSSAPIPLYLKTQSGNYNLKAGTYTDTIVVNWSWSVCKGIEIGFICLGRSEGETVWTSTVSLTVENDCIINAPDINFGASPLVSSFKPVTQTVSIYCTKDTSYSIGLSDGIHPDGKQRRLEYNGNYINYEIYQGGTGSLRWGSSSGERRSSLSADVNPGSGSGSNTLLQGFIYQATILPGQTTPPAGVYTDSVILDVTF